VDKQYLDMGDDFGSGSNWLQLRPPKIRISLFVSRESQEDFKTHYPCGARSRVERIRGMENERSE